MYAACCVRMMKSSPKKVPSLSQRATRSAGRSAVDRAQSARSAEPEATKFLLGEMMAEMGTLILLLLLAVPLGPGNNREGGAVSFFRGSTWLPTAKSSYVVLIKDTDYCGLLSGEITERPADGHNSHCE